MRTKRAKSILSIVLCTGVLIQSPTFAAQSVVKRTEVKTTDVALQEGGIIVGQVVDQQGVPQQAKKVSMTQQGAVIAVATTDAEGFFAVQRVRGGEYTVVTDKGFTSVRAWAPQTAPPSALATTRVVEDGQITRANGYGSGKAFAAVLVGLGVVGAGVAIVESQDDNS